MAKQQQENTSGVIPLVTEYRNRGRAAKGLAVFLVASIMAMLVFKLVPFPFPLGYEL
ncbi:uncharacterized protein H6S33_007659 [Morchella sextelata]|jgi:hypothetical protein|uniref:uncharacterized protein n=1 Tax=Morchella sextelata TaxID=1174677 RepID=UPI001D0451A2|nr:uncharacterized protein H6S33_007659 [Morchella sextelata]KAH0603337.1 hypothetical protein H6S33_007659 [Morchella sextelata]